MCTYQTEQIKVTGSGKGAGGWFGLTDASVYYDHPVHAAAEHSLNIDFLNPARARRPGSRWSSPPSPRGRWPRRSRPPSRPSRPTCSEPGGPVSAGCPARGAPA